MKCFGENEINILAQAYRLCLFLDYDGTLTPIVRHPSLARLSSSRKKVLRELSRLPNVKVCIVSGRILSALKRMVGVSKFVYVGNHGFEGEGPGIRYHHFTDRKRRALLAIIHQKLKQQLGSIPGVFIENKTLTVSVHYRRVSKKDLAKVKLNFLRITMHYIHKSKIHLVEGKKVMEVRPDAQWNKGTAVMWVLDRLASKSRKGIFPVYVGDDRTDEDAFISLKRRGMTVKVTMLPREYSEAQYFLHSPAKVFVFLKKIIAIRKLMAEGYHP